MPDSLAGERVDRAVSLLTGLSRSRSRALVESEGVLVEGQRVGAARRLVAGERLEVLLEPEAPPVLRADPDVELDLRHVDDHVLVVAKPAGLVVHPGAGPVVPTLAGALLHRFPEIAGVGDPLRPGIVHRLDRDSSGLLVVARTAEAHRHLVAQMVDHLVERRYLALVLGRPDARRGAIDAPIGRSERRFDRMAVREGGKPALTTYEVREELPGPDLALLACELSTGRTHQIRVHLSAIGHPVAGDPLYGGARAWLPLARPFLHACALAFTHPADGERRRFEDELPGELEEALRWARAGGPTRPDGEAGQPAREAGQSAREAGQSAREAGQSAREAGQSAREAGQSAREDSSGASMG